MRPTDIFFADQAKDKKLCAQWGAATTVFLGISWFSLGLFVASTIDAP